MILFLHAGRQRLTFLLFYFLLLFTFFHLKTVSALLYPRAYPIVEHTLAYTLEHTLHPVVEHTLAYTLEHTLHHVVEHTL